MNRTSPGNPLHFTWPFLAAALVIVVIAIVGAFVGCESAPSAPPPTQAQIEADVKTRLETNILPKGSKVLEILGNQWVLVEIPIQSKTRKAVFRQSSLYHGRHYGYESFSQFSWLPE